jgi:hypothetical protein
MFVQKVPLPPSIILDIHIRHLSTHIRHFQKNMQSKKLRKT